MHEPLLNVPEQKMIPAWPSEHATPVFNNLERGYFLGPAFMQQGSISIGGLEFGATRRAIIFSIACAGVVHLDTFSTELNATPGALSNEIDELISDTGGWAEKGMVPATGGIVFRLTPRGADALRNMVAHRQA